MNFKEGDKVTPIGWLLSTPKPTGTVLYEYKHPLTGQRLVMVKWDDFPNEPGRALSPSVIELVKFTYKYEGQFSLDTIMEHYNIDPSHREHLRRHLDNAVDECGMTVEAAVADWLA